MCVTALRCRLGAAHAPWSRRGTSENCPLAGTVSWEDHRAREDEEAACRAQSVSKDGRRRDDECVLDDSWRDLLQRLRVAWLCWPWR
jgi:hypothetical protein